MKIGRIETFYVPPRWLFVRVETDDGAVGWGEASLEGHAEAVDGAFEALRDRFIGHDPFRIEDIWQIGYRGGFYRGGPVLMSALAGLEQALWDLKGRALGLPAWEMLGGRVRDKVRAYAWIGGDRPHEIADAAKARARAGLLRGQDERHGRARLDRHAQDCSTRSSPASRRLRRRAWTSASTSTGGSTGRWRSSSPRRWSRSDCCSSRSRCCRRIRKGCAQIAKLVSTPIALGERLYSRWDFKPFFESGAVDIIQPDLSHAGGILECRKIAAMAEAYDIAVAPHCPLGPLALASCLQLAACAPNVAIQEMSLGIHYNVGADLFTYCKQQGAADAARRLSCRSRRVRASAWTSTRMWCGRRTRNRTAGATRSGATRTAASRSGERRLGLGDAADPALGDVVVAARTRPRRACREASRSPASGAGRSEPL